MEPGFLRTGIFWGGCSGSACSSRVAVLIALGTQSRKDKTMQTRSPSFQGLPAVAGCPAPRAEFARA